MAAFDAHGVQNCGGTPTTCSPLWCDVTDYPPATDNYPVVQGSTMYISTGEVTGGLSSSPYFGFSGDLEAFPVAGCGSTTCSPTATGLQGDFSSYPLVAGDGAVIASGPVVTSGFSAVSASNVNAELWTSTVSTDGEAMAGSVVYAQGAPQNVDPYVNYDIYAFHAGGSADCRGLR